MLCNCFLEGTVGVLGEISGSHGGEYEDYSLLGLMALMMETVRISETSVFVYVCPRRLLSSKEYLFIRRPTPYASTSEWFSM
jgi:hypothetical protein